MTLEEMRAALRKMQEALAALKDKAFSAEGTEADVDALEKHVKDILALEKKIDLAELSEKAAARAARPANDTTTGTLPAVNGAGDGASVSTRRSLLPHGLTGQDLLVRVAAATILAKGRGQKVLQVLDDEGYGQIAGLLADVRDPSGKAVNTLVSSEGGVLVPTPLTGGIMPLLRVESSFIAANPVRVTLVNGQYVLPRGLAGATASYVAEGALKPVSTPTFDAISMRAKKLAGIVPITNEAVRWTIGAIEEYVRADLQNALALTLDLNAWLGTGAGASPLGILNKVGVQTVTPTFVAPTAPTLAELDTFARLMILKLTTANILTTGRWRWVMPYRTALKLADMRVGAGTDGEAAFPEMSLGRAGGPVWKGFPVIVTAQIPTNLGAGTDETTIALVDFAHVLFGEEEGITMRMSSEATLDVTGAGSLVHLFQSNMFAILAEAMHDFGLRTVKAVVKATAIRW